MIGKGLFIQILMLVLAVGIVLTYIQPEFAKVSEVQDNIKTYQDKRNEVLTVNSRLASLVSVRDGIAPADERNLFTYLPNEVDTIAVVRDLYLISIEAGVIYQNANFTGVSEVNEDEVGPFGSPVPYTFDLEVEGTYTQIKELFALIESNHYPLEIHNLQINRLEGGFLSVSVSLVTYAFDGMSTNGGDQI